jgi:predicted nucleic acid-binding protein
MTVCFLDNDVIIKLTTCGLLSEALECLKIDQSNARVLSSARFVFGSSKMRKKHSEQVLSSATEFVKGCMTIPPQDSDDYRLLEQQIKNDIDAGEATLIAAAVQESNFWIVTGDKRCLKALAATKELDSIHKKLQGHVICLEQIICKLITAQGFASVREKVVPARDCDQVLKSAFGSGSQSECQNVLETLNSYIEDLRKISNNLLTTVI